MPARRVTSTHRGLHIHHVDPLPKGLACLCCRQRKVRCDGASPACATCVRSARHEGKDVSLVRCEYAIQRRKRRVAPQARESSASASSGTESEDHSDSDLHDESESESFAGGARFLSDLSEEPEGIERDLENLAKLLNLQLQEAQPFSSSTPIARNSYDSGYSSDSSFASHDAIAYEDSFATASVAPSATTNPFFSFDTSSLSFSNSFAPTSGVATNGALPLSSDFAFVDPASVFSYLPQPLPTPKELTLASLPISGDYFTQSPVDLIKVIPRHPQESFVPKVMEVQPLRPEWNSWLTL